MNNSKLYTADIMHLARYGIDSASVILNKIVKLMEEGWDYKRAIAELENYYKDKKDAL